MDEAAPRPWSRRAFVKGCLMASAAGMAAAGAQGLVGPALGPPTHGRRVDYIGSTVVRGPAPQGLPLLALALDGEGALRGVARPPGFEAPVLDWYRYCGHTRTPGLRPSFEGDERLRYFATPDKVPTIEAYRREGERGDAGWYLGKLGEVARAADFEEVGWGAPVRWRSEGRGGKDIVTAIVLKVDPAALDVAPADRALVEGFLVPTPDGAALLAYVSFCKHFCCVPGWHESPGARIHEAVDALYCSCHHSVYDPLRIRPDFYLLQVEADEAPA